MANFNTIRTTIDANITHNGNQEITGGVLNSVLTQMVDSTEENFEDLRTNTDGKLAELSEETEEKIVTLRNNVTEDITSLSERTTELETLVAELMEKVVPTAILGEARLGYAMIN